MFSCGADMSHTGAVSKPVKTPTGNTSLAITHIMYYELVTKILGKSCWLSATHYIQRKEHLITNIWFNFQKHISSDTLNSIKNTRTFLKYRLTNLFRASHRCFDVVFITMKVKSKAISTHAISFIHKVDGIANEHRKELSASSKWTKKKLHKNQNI